MKFYMIYEMEEFLKENQGYDKATLIAFMIGSATPEVWFERIKEEVIKVAEEKKLVVTFGENPFKDKK